MTEIFDISDEEGLAEILEYSQNEYQDWKPKPIAPQKNLKQTTLFGTQSLQSINIQPQPKPRHNWPLSNKNEKPTHHKLNGDEINTWIYPTNLGTIREYQFNIVARGLYHNLLVALPTGLGKTFIAATIMLNWFRWTKDAQIVFVAPTKPLVSQQVEACFHIAGIPRSATTMLTGEIQPGVRAEEWASKRVFFMTPQTLINDLKRGSCDPKRVVLLVVDEAHRATGGYAYVEVVKFLRRFNTSFRILALTATPGSNVESVQAVIDGLGISNVEIRTEESLDIRQYVYPRKIETQEFEALDEMEWIYEELSKALQPLVNLMRSKNAYWSKDPMSLTSFGCNQARQRWMASDAGKRANWGEKSQVMWVFSTLASIAHSIELLKFHGIVPFYHKIKAFNDDAKGGKYAKQVKDHQSFQDILTKVRGWIVKDDFIGHPKLDYLQTVVINHFVSANEGRHPDPEVSASKTRIMIFAHFRDSAEEIVRVLNRNSPIVKAHVFVGQANSAGSDGMNQKKQLEIIEQFRKGDYNTLVATSIGEEGLDIGEIDLIICYDASASPIRMLQRMGRTGRKRAGEIVVLLMKGKEAEKFAVAKDSYEKMQLMIADGQRFTFHTDLLSRIIPKEIQPIVDKRIVDIPIENSQATLPEPTRRGRPRKKAPPKKFHMPDGVETGFTTAARIDTNNAKSPPKKKPKTNKKPTAQVPIQRISSPIPEPAISSVSLSAAENDELERNYLQIAGDESQTIDLPRLDAFPSLQKSSRPTVHIKHGAATIRMQQTLTTLSRTTMASVQKLEANLDPADTQPAHRTRIKQNSRTVKAVSRLSPMKPRSPTPSIHEIDNDTPEPFWASPAKPTEFAASQDLPDLDTVLGLDKPVSSASEHDIIQSRLKRRRILDSDSDE